MNTLSLSRRLPVASGLLLLAACRSDSTAPRGGPPLAVAVVPSTASLLTGGSQDFTATVTNDPSNSGVTWSIKGCSGGASACGRLSNVTSTTATYTAPTTVPPGTLGVTATSVSENTKSVTATVAITAIVAAGQIAFISYRDGARDIYVMNADGSGVTRLTNSQAFKYSLVWSPDGAKIASSSDRDANDEIYVMNADGTGLVNLSNNPDADGTGLVNLSNNPATDFADGWSPDGTKIAFHSNRDGNWEIYVMNVDGSNLLNLTSNPANDYGAVWSPDGSKIAFPSDRDGNDEIYVMNADGSGVTRLTNNPAADGGPIWSPDGTKIAFRSDRDGNLELYVMNADGSGVTRLTTTGGVFAPAWSPDGTKIVFENERDGEVYLMNADGSGLRNLTNNPAIDRAPAWRPRGP